MSDTMLKRIESWAYGLLAAFIGGGASTITTQAGLVGAQSLGVDVQPLNIKALAIVFVSSGIFSACAYLKQSPLPKLDVASDSGEVKP